MVTKVEATLLRLAAALARARVELRGEPDAAEVAVGCTELDCAISGALDRVARKATLGPPPHSEAALKVVPR